MLRDLSKLIDDEDSEGGDGERLQKELRQAAQSLWRAQFIYENDWGMKTSYEVHRCASWSRFATTNGGWRLRLFSVGPEKH